VGVDSKGEGQGSTFFFELPLFPKVNFEMIGNEMIGNEMIGSSHSSVEPSRCSFEPSPRASFEPSRSSFDPSRFSFDPSSFDSFVEWMNEVKKPRALIVEDDAVCAKYTARSLMSCGYLYFIVGDGIEAIKIVQQSILYNLEFAIIIMDNRLPGLDGPEVIRKIRDMNFTNAIIGVTGDVGDETKLSFLEAGASTLFPKPLSQKTIQAYLTSISSIPPITVFPLDYSRVACKLLSRLLLRLNVNTHSYKGEIQVFLKPKLQESVLAYISSLSSRSPITALIVDDSEVACKLLSRSLLKLNIDTHAIVHDGVYAVEHVALCLSMGDRCPYDVIFMDNSMPIMNGPSAARAIRRMGVTVPIIGVTGNMLEDDVHQFKDGGANAVLAKPINQERLLSVLEDNGFLVL
jgi:CheY-like chemotaxis protein